ncbi:MAG TPA: PsbP-related protein [Thermodesulfovibrionales bacterium]|nr:PsbP-related protein [Thermodesulfovibrionales bacterium]
MNRKTPPSCFLSVSILICIIASLLIAGCVAPPKDISPSSAAPTTVTVSKATTVPTLTTSFNQYSNPKYGFSIDYPNDWQKNELNKLEPEIPWTRYDVVEFYSPSFLRCNTDKTDCVNVRAEVKIEVDTNPVSTELDTFFVKDVARITTGNPVEITKRDSMFKLSGDKAYRLDYNLRSEKEDIKVLSAYTIQNGNGYIITYHAHAPERNERINQFEQYYNDVMTMFSSFKANAGNYKTI